MGPSHSQAAPTWLVRIEKEHVEFLSRRFDHSRGEQPLTRSDSLARPQSRIRAPSLDRRRARRYETDRNTPARHQPGGRAVGQKVLEANGVAVPPSTDPQ